MTISATILSRKMYCPLSLSLSLYGNSTFQVKGNIFDGGVRAVACVYSPLIDSPSRVSTQLFHITDWLPTLYTAAGGDPSDLKDFDGVDQWAVIKNASKSKRQSFLVNIDEKTDSEAALMGQYKLIRGTYTSVLALARFARKLFL